MKIFFQNKIPLLLLNPIAIGCFLLITVSNPCNAQVNDNKVDLSGQWRFQIDSLDRGVYQTRNDKS